MVGFLGLAFSAVAEGDQRLTDRQEIAILKKQVAALQEKRVKDFNNRKVLWQYTSKVGKMTWENDRRLDSLFP